MLSNRRNFLLFFGASFLASLLGGMNFLTKLVNAEDNNSDTEDNNINNNLNVESKTIENNDLIDWFKLKPDAEKSWKMLTDPNNSLQFKLVEQDKENQGLNQKVFVLFPRQSSAYNTAMNTILSIFHVKKIPAVFTVVNFDQQQELAEKALALAKAEKFDLIFAMGSESADFLYNNFQIMLPNKAIPVVSVCAKDPVILGQMKDYETGSNSNIAFTSLNVPVAVQMAYLKKLKPNLRNIAVMYDKQNKSAIETQFKPLVSVAEKYQINIIEVAVNQETAQEDLQQEIPVAIEKIVQTDRDMENSIFWITGSTSVFQEIATINQLADRIPVLSVVPDVVAAGENSAILAIGVSFESNAYLAALYGTDILQGKSRVDQLPVGIVSPPDIAINFRKSRKIGLKIPFNFFESASYVYDAEGILVRDRGQTLR